MARRVEARSRSEPRRHRSKRSGSRGESRDRGPRCVATAVRATLRREMRASRSRSGSRDRGADRAVLVGRGHSQTSTRDRDGDRDRHGHRDYQGGDRRQHGRGPLPRPGYDEDRRLQKLEDDPRYFEGAELGKAQRAAMGQTGLHGRNTASFDPASTLVRPAMRVFYGPRQKRYDADIRPDDVIMVPGFSCDEDDWSSYTEMVQELVRLKSETGLKLSDVPACGKALRRACKYAHMDEEKIAVQLCWYEKGPKEKPFTIDFGDFKSRPSRSLNCAVSLSFGDAMELAFIRSGSEETVFLDRPNGSLSLVGRDAWKRWKAGPRLSSKERSTRGHLSITVLGFTEKVVEEKELAPAPTDEKIGDKAWDGCLDEPCHDVVRPSMRVIAVPTSRKYERPVKHDDVIIVPEFFCKEDDWDIYYQLLKEMRESQAQGTRKAEWLSWHEGAHLLSQNPTGSASYQKVLDRMCEYFHIALGNRGTRFNWYRDGSDWKPFHHDSAAFNPMRAKDQNCTVGISFGASRELAFRHAKTGELVYFPQRNGMLFYFGQDANIIWQHGINALPKEEQDGKGRISIILWGLCTTTVDEPGSPPMLTDESRGKGKGKGKDKGKGKGKGKDKSWGFSMHQRR